MANDLLQSSELDEFPGAPFAQSIVDAAVSGLRAEAGWHIAPERTETVTVDGTGEVLLKLPTLRLGTIAEVRDVTDPALPVVLTDWRVSRAGILYRALGWPLGFGTVEVDMTHGYAEVPADLFALVAERCQRLAINSVASQQAAGPFSMTVREDKGNSSLRLAPYMLPVGQ